MLKFDFTNKLTATLSDVPRKHVIKFNNSWLLLNNTEQQVHFLVAYRAIVFKNRLLKDGPEFASSQPTVPGHPGTPWGEGWQVGPKGNATEEGRVPEGRCGRYFDGVGLAEITVDFGNLSDLENSVKVTKDIILENSDGYEDPRIFTDGKSYYLHCHRAHPDTARGVTDHPEDLPVIEKIKLDEAKRAALCVKINRLKATDGKYALGDEFYFGIEKSRGMEKNFGFFFEKDYLNTVYGVAPGGKNYTVFHSEPKKISQCKSGANIPVSMLMPHKAPVSSINLECFMRLEQYYLDSFMTDALVIPVQFSSSGPLIETKDGKFLGVGHVKVAYFEFFGLLKQLIKTAKQRHPYQFTTDQQAFAELMNNRVLVEMTLWSLIMGDDTKKDSMGKYVNSVPPEFYQSSLFQLFGTYLLNEENWRPAYSGNALENPLVKNAGKSIMHWDCQYFSFLYEIEDSDHGNMLCRFSNSFLISHPNEPLSLQYATNLTPCPNGYMMGIGENDFRATAAFLQKEEVDEMLQHKADNFSVRDYKFEVITTRPE